MQSHIKILTVGEILWDAFPEGERLGGAPFNLAVNFRRLGHDVRFVSAVGADDRGTRALAAIGQHGLGARFVRRIPQYATGVVTVALDATGQPSFTIERPAAYDFAVLTPGDLAELSAWAPEWICFGTLHQFCPQGRILTGQLIEAAPRARRFYDLNLRRDSFTPDLVAGLLCQAHVLKLNEAEVDVAAEISGMPASPIAAFCRRAVQKYGYQAIAVTLGARGCALQVGSEYIEAAAPPVEVKDTVGAGDAFAAAFVHGLSQGWPPAETGAFANKLGALVASKAGAIPDWE